MTLSFARQLGQQVLDESEGGSGGPVQEKITRVLREIVRPYSLDELDLGALFDQLDTDKTGRADSPGLRGTVFYILRTRVFQGVAGSVYM